MAEQLRAERRRSRSGTQSNRINENGIKRMRAGELVDPHESAALAPIRARQVFEPPQ
ncbi:MAG: hypothetical protein ACYC0T_13445 [Ramlibacter sp.]